MRVQSRRTDVFPTTWEIPVGIGLSWVLAFLLALPVGQGIAFLAFERDFVWPGQNLGTSLLGLLTGDPGRGLPAAVRSNSPPTAAVYACAALTALALTMVAGWCLAWWWRTVGPLAQFGLATRAEVAFVLGPGALRRRRRNIRPDVHRRLAWRARE